jgi:cytidylate kinase
MTEERAGNGGRRNVICISHETGAGGVEVGQAVSERLGVPYVDEDIVVRAAEKGGVSHELVADAEERKSLALRLVRTLAWAGTPVAVPPESLLDLTDDYRRLIVDVIRETADQGDVVIVAHAASVALADHPGVLRVLVTAPQDVRVREVAAASALDDRAARKLVKDSDAGRASYFKRFHGLDHELPAQYDLVVNTERFTPDAAAALITEAAAAGSAAAAEPAVD